MELQSYKTTEYCKNWVLLKLSCESSGETILMSVSVHKDNIVIVRESSDLPIHNRNYILIQGFGPIEVHEKTWPEFLYFMTRIN